MGVRVLSVSCSSSLVIYRQIVAMKSWNHSRPEVIVEAFVLDTIPTISHTEQKPDHLDIVVQVALFTQLFYTARLFGAR